MDSNVPEGREPSGDRDFSRVMAEFRQWQGFKVAAAYAVVAWLLVQIVATVGPAFDWPDWVLRAVVLAAIVGFLATMGVVLFRPRLTVAGRMPTYLSLRARLIAGIAVLLVAAAAAVLSVRSFSMRDEVSLAVLPFSDLSPARDKGYFAEGIAEEILSALAAEKDIKVLGRTSARQIERNPDPKVVRASLGVTHLLEGSTRTSGNALRVNVRLIDTSDGSQVWEEEYDGGLADVFKVQDSIAATVVQRLRGTFLKGRAKAAAPTAIDTYQTYLAARAIMRDRSQPNLMKAFGLARQVIASDPKYAPGQALYAELVWLLSDDPDAYGTIPRATAARVGRVHAQRAIKLAPKLADGYAALGLVAEQAEAISALQRAIQLDPSRADVRIWLATRLTQALRFDDALPVATEAAAIEPLWAMPVFDLVVRLAVNGQIADARRLAEQFRSRSGNEAQYRRLLFMIDSRGTDISSAIRRGETALEIDPTLSNIRLELLQLYSLLGLAERAGPVPSAQLAAPFYRGDLTALQARVQASGAKLWDLSDSGIGFFRLAAVRDWPALVRLYDARRTTPELLCIHALQAAQSIVPALRALGRTQEAKSLLNCLSKRSSVEARQKSRSWYAYPGDLEYDQATLAALSGNPEAAFASLNNAVDRGWIGRPYSSRLTDRPQFDALSNDPRYSAIQGRIDVAIARERAEIITSP